MTDPAGKARVIRVVLLVAVLAAAGATLYTFFVLDVLGRGAAVVAVKPSSAAGRKALLLAFGGVAALAASGLAGLALRRHRLAPLASLGLGLVPSAVFGASAFLLGRTALALALVMAGPVAIAALVACLTPPRPRPGPGRFLLRSWMATSFLLSLGLACAFGLRLLEQAKPRVPWASVAAAFAMATLLQLAARYLILHGAAPHGAARDHEQVRRVQEDDLVRRTATRLHPFVEEGNAITAYTELEADLARAAHQAPPPAPRPALGPRALAEAVAMLAAALQAAALAAPLATIVPLIGWPTAALAFALVLPWARLRLAPSQEPSPRMLWLASSLLCAAAGAWLGSHLVSTAFGILTLPGAAIAAAPYLVVLLVTLRPRPAPPHLAYLRREHAARLARDWRRSAGRGGAVTLAAVLLPILMQAVEGAMRRSLVEPPVAVLAAFAASGVAWALAAALTGPAAAAHRRRLDAFHAQATRQRRDEHVRFLERLETAPVPTTTPPAPSLTALPPQTGASRKEA